MNPEQELNSKYCWIYYGLFFIGILSGAFCYMIFNLPANTAWPFALSGIFSLLLPITFGVIRKGNVTGAINELVKASCYFNHHFYKRDPEVLHLYYFKAWCVIVLISVVYSAYEFTL